MYDPDFFPAFDNLSVFPHKRFGCNPTKSYLIPPFILYQITVVLEALINKQFQREEIEKEQRKE